MKLSVMYRGPLGSCNYGCKYCPFAKRTDGRERFTRRLQELQTVSWNVLFTPWGEALIRRWYQTSLTELCQVAQIDSVCIQTNLSCSLDWISKCDVEKLALWATYHPTETTSARFVEKVRRVHEDKVRVSVGMVAIPEFLSEAQRLRAILPPDVCMWLNAQLPRSRAYTDDEIQDFTAIDPQFPLTLRKHRSRGRFCRAGESSFTVDGEGMMRRCHFVDHAIGNFYDDNWFSSLQPRTCPNRFCHCYLGISQLESETLTEVYTDNILERQMKKNAFGGGNRRTSSRESR
jgi:hypothetical protein